MYCLVEFEEHLYDDPLNELGDLEFPEPLEDGKASFGELQVCELHVPGIKRRAVFTRLPRSGFNAVGLDLESWVGECELESGLGVFTCSRAGWNAG